jgi:uncharacterized linocin/CFP29 family protein
MTDFFLRDQAPLSAAQWSLLENAVIQTARESLIGRRFIPLIGPFGAGLQAIADDTITGTGRGHVDLLGNADDAVTIERRRFLALPLIYKDFWLHWRDLQAAEQFGLPLDVGKASAAAAACVRAEDSLIFHGDLELDQPGLLTVEGRQRLPLRDWGVMGEAFNAVVQGVQTLTEAGFYGPYALAVSPRLYAQLNRIFDGTGVLEVEQIEKLVRLGVYQSAVLPDNRAVMVAGGAQNLDLAVGFDLTVAFVESTNLNHHFRALESLVLRIKRPGATLTFDA